MSHEQDYDEYESELDDEIRAKQDAMADMASDEKSPQKQITAEDLLNATRMFVWGDYQAIIIGIADDSDPDYFTIYNPRGYDEESESIIIISSVNIEFQLESSQILNFIAADVSVGGFQTLLLARAEESSEVL